METMHTDSKSTRRDMPVIALVSIGEWLALQASELAAAQAAIDEEPLDPTEWGGASLVSGYDTTCVAGAVLS